MTKLTAISHKSVHILFGRLPLVFDPHHGRERFHCCFAVAIIETFESLENLVDARHGKFLTKDAI